MTMWDSDSLMTVSPSIQAIIKLMCSRKWLEDPRDDKDINVETHGNSLDKTVSWSMNKKVIF